MQGVTSQDSTSIVVKQIHYISSPYGLEAVLIKQGQNVTTYFAETDYLGSINGLMNAGGTYAEQFSYDAWGRRRHTTNWTYANVPAPNLIERGYTGHEHLDLFGLINMNGRMYDPVVGRFLGVDPVVQAPEYSQSYNGYSYCWNNPLKYTDPSGYKLDELTIYDIVNNLWNSGGGYWSSLTPDYYMPYYHDYDPHENSLLEYSSFQFLSTLLADKDGAKTVYYNKKRDEYGYWSKTVISCSSISYVKPKRYIDGYIGYGKFNINVSTKWIGLRLPAGGGGMPGWASDANTGVNAFLVGNGAKTELLDYAVRTNYKSARKSSQFNKLRPTQQAWRTTNTLGKTGSQYLKYVKGLGYVGAGLTTTYSAVNAGSYYYNGGTDWQVGAKATLDVIMTGVGFLGPIGFGISAIYFVVDVAGGFGDFGEIKP